MKAAIYNSPGDYMTGEVQDPHCPTKGLLIKVLACGLCGSDLRTLQSGHHRVKPPFVIGHEISGEVIERGADCAGDWKVGDKIAISPVVYCNRCVFCRDGIYELCTDHKEIGQAWPGGFAEYIAADKELLLNGSIQMIPGGVDPVHATVAEPLSSCLNAQEKVNIKMGEMVVVIGAGPVGTLHMVLAQKKGAYPVVVADIDPFRLEYNNAYRPDHVINASEDELVEKVFEISDGKGAEVVIAANSVPDTLVQAVKMTKKGGRVVIFGGLPADQACPPVNMNIVHYNALQLTGTTIFAPRHHRMALKLVASDKGLAEQVISHVLPLTAFAEGVDLALAGKARKVVFVP